MPSMDMGDGGGDGGIGRPYGGTYGGEAALLVFSYKQI